MALEARSGTSSFRLPLGEEFKPLAWKATYHMDFSLACLYCNVEGLVGYHVQNEAGIPGYVVVCPQCSKTNGNYH